MAQLLNFFPGSAVELWEKFDDIFLHGLLNETIEIKKKEQEYIDEQVNISKKHIPDEPSDDTWFTPSYTNSFRKKEGLGYTIKCNDLEDIEATPEEVEAMNEWIRANGITIVG